MESLIKRNELTWNNAKLLEEYSSCSLASASMHFKEKVDLIDYSIQLCQSYKFETEFLILEIEKFLEE